MLNSISISNYKGFDALEVKNLSNFNLIIGKNNVGKTALIEALFLSLGPGNPDLINKISIFRNLIPPILGDKSLWSALFHNFEVSSPIKIVTTDNRNNRTNLIISLTNVDNKSKALELDAGNDNYASSTKSLDEIDRLIFESRINESGPIQSSMFVENGETKIKFGSHKEKTKGMYISSRAAGTGPTEAKRFSKLEIKNQHSIVVEALQMIEPNLNRLLVVSSGNTSLLYGDIGIGQSIPLQYMGEGISKLAIIILAMSEVQNGGTVLIDEIDAGFHYSVQKDIVKAIFEFAYKFNIQVVVTSHNLEFIRNVNNAFNEIKSEKLSVFRLFRKNKKIRISQYDKSSLDTVFESGWEIR